MQPFTLEDFVRESNRIEGIHRDPTQAEINAHIALLACDAPTVDALASFVHVVAGAMLRSVKGFDVRVGNHVAPPGGPELVASLETVLRRAQSAMWTPRAVHQEYETLHPFMDGNGRSGRALWLWQLGGIERAPLGFLHTYYYQTLAEAGR